MAESAHLDRPAESHESLKRTLIAATRRPACHSLAARNASQAVCEVPWHGPRRTGKRVTTMRTVVIAVGAILLGLAAYREVDSTALDARDLEIARGGVFGDCAATGESCDSQTGDGCTGPGDDDCLYCTGANINDLYCAGWLGLCGTFNVGCGWITIGECMYDTNSDPPTFPPCCEENGSPSETPCLQVQGCWET